MQGGFSIREYASRMRSINVVNCWPFDETVCEETVQSLLPPITVKKFIWWLDELEYLHSESPENLNISEKKMKKKKKKRKGEKSLRNEDQNMEEFDIDVEEGKEVVKVKSVKGKMKAPKKRSIVEIFAVAPPVERVTSEEEDSDEEDESFKQGKKTKTKMNKDTDIILRKACRVVKKIKKKKMGQSVPNKEKFFKLKLQAQDKATGNPSSSYSKDFEHNILDRVSTLKRKPSMLHLDAHSETVPYEAFKLIEENQHPGLPVRGILKNHGETFPLKQSTKSILQEDSQVNQYGTKMANKHVTFSKNDEILRLARKPSHSIEYFKFQKVCGSDMGNANYAGVVDKDPTIMETSGSMDASIRIGKELGAGPVSNEHLAAYIVDSTAFMRPNNEGHSRMPEASERSLLHHMNQDWSATGLRDMPHNPADVCPPRFFRMPLDEYYSNPNIKAISNPSNSTCRRSGPVSPMCFEDCLRTYNEPSVSHLSYKEERKHTSFESTAMNSPHSLQFQTYPHLSPKVLMHTFCSPPDGSQNGNICGRGSISEDFVGLPLNSQGELIALNSNAKREVNQMMNSSGTAAHSVSSSLPSNVFSKCLGRHSEWRSLDCRTSSMNQLNLFPVESYVKENPMAIIPSRLGITGFQSENQTNFDIDFPETNYHFFHDSENIMCRGDSRVQRSRENEKIQSTMRLMGKEFKVGGTGVQGFDDGHWKDKQIIDELHFGNNSTSNVVHDQYEPASGKLRESLFCPSEIAINHRSESKYSLPHFDRQTSSMYPGIFVARKIDAMQNSYPRLSPGTLSEVYNNESLFSEPFTSGYESQLFTLELPTPTTAHQELSPNMSSSSMQLKNKQNLPHSSISAIRFPFLHPDLDGHAISSCGRRSSVNPVPLCFDVSRNETRLSNSKSCSPGHNHPYLKPGSSHETDTSVPLEPDDFRMFFPLSSGLASQTSVAPVSLAPMPCHPGIFMQKRHGNQKKIKERIKSRVGIRGLDSGRKSKLQPTALSTVPFKPFKMPTSGFHENTQCVVRKPTSHVSFEDSVENVEDAYESCSTTNQSRFVVCGEYDQANKDARTISPWVDSHIDTARTGPVKLTGGTKHILKACQHNDQSSSKSTDQDISLSATTIGFRFSESENSAKIYRNTPPLEL